MVSVSVVYRPDVGRFSRQLSLPGPIDTGEEIYQAALRLLAARDHRRAVGTLGVALAGLTAAGAGQLDLFSGAPLARRERLETAMDKISKLGSTSGDLSELKHIAKKKLNPLKGKPAGERIVPAFTFQIQKASTFLLDLNPNVGWKFTPRLMAGMGWNERLSFSKWNNVVEGDRIFGPRGFTSFGIGHGFSLKAELERMNVFIPTFYGTMDGSRSWVWGAFAGFKKDYSFYGRIAGNFQVLYNLYDDHDCSPYVDKLNVRMGFEFPIKKKAPAPKCSPCSLTTPI